MAFELEVEKTVSVDVSIFDVELKETGSDLEFEATVDGDGDIRIEVTNSTEEILKMLDIDDIKQWLEEQDV